MRRSVIIQSMLVLPLSLLLASCSTSYRLDRPLESRPDDWLQHGGNPGRTNVSSHAPRFNFSAATMARDISRGGTDGGDAAKPTDERIDETRVRWEFSLDGMAAKAAPLVVDGIMVFSSTTGLAEAVDLRNGERAGTFPCKWFIHGTPAVVDGCLFVATSGIEPLLLCFDLKDRVLRYETRIPSVHAPICGVGRGVIMATHGGDVALHVPGDSAAVWKVTLDGPITAAPAAEDSIVVIAAQNGDLHALDLRDGTRRWRVPSGAAFLASPAIHAGTVAAVNVSGDMLLVNLADGALRWRRGFGEPVYHGPAWRGDTIAVALSGGDVVLLRQADGTEIRRVRTGELPGSAPLFAGGSILLLQRRGVLLAIEIATGRMKEIVHLDHRSETAPLLTEEGVVLVDEEGEVVCLEIDDKMER